MANVAALLVCLMTIALCYGQSDSLQPPVCTSRFDYDFKVMQTLSDLQTQITNIKEEVGKRENTDVSERCLDSWVPFEGKCYYFLTEKRQYSYAKEYCENYGGKLAEPFTSSANEFLKAVVRQYKTNQWWFGLNDIDVEGKWVWTKSNKKPIYGDWKRGNPNAGRGANCGGLWQQYNYGWVDEACSRTYNAICEI